MGDRPTVFCKDCKFAGWFGGPFRRCKHPSAVRFGSEYSVTGKRPPNKMCSDMRGVYDTPCGPDAKLWEPRK